MSEKPPRPTDVSLVEAGPDDYAVVARMLGESFGAGKYRLALGADVARRCALIEVMLRHHALAPGRLYVGRLPDGRVVGSLVLKFDNAPIQWANRRAALGEMARQAGWARAWWATLFLSLFSSPRVAPHSCYIDNLVVAPEFRGGRVAFGLVRQTYDVARSLGKTEVQADATWAGKRMRALVKYEGWEVVSRNALLAPLTRRLLGFDAIYRVRKDLTRPPASH